MEIMIFAASFLSFGIRNAFAVAKAKMAAGPDRAHRPLRDIAVFPVA